MMLARLFKDRVNPTLLRSLGVAPAPRTRFLMGQRMLLFDALSIETVLDVGANTGQYGRELRRLGYRSAIHSFEPMAAAFADLAVATRSDSSWAVAKLALGAMPRTADLFAWDGAAGESSSMHRPNSTLVDLLGPPQSEQVDVTTLDTWIDRSEPLRLDRTWLKIDTQGSESDVLHGARCALNHVAAVEIELPLRHWYESSADLCTLMSMLLDHGLVPATIMTERFRKEWNGAVDVDAIFTRATA